MSQLDTESPVLAARSERVFKAPREFTRLRELSRIHMTLVGDVVRAQARIKSLYRSHGVLVTGVDVYSTCRRAEWQKQLCSSAQTRATRLYDHLDFLREQKKQAEADLLREAKKHGIVRILETAPGFGPIRAAGGGSATPRISTSPGIYHQNEHP